MQKINWFKRIFMSWSKLEAYFGITDQSKDTDMIVKQAKLANDVEHLNEQLKESKKHVIDLRQENQKKDLRIEKLEKQLTIEETKKDGLIAKEKKWNDDLKNVELQKQKLEERLQQTNYEKGKIEADISEKLKTLGKIEQTFFGKAGNKGKGELGEMQLKNILERSGISPEFWTENLMVNSKVVEFAMKSGKQDKWIPVDSKVLEPNVDDEDQPIIDAAYLKKVEQAARQIAKYTGKKNTESYALLVLQSDLVYNKIYEEDPGFFPRLIREQKIHVASPSSFVQFAFSIAHIIEIYEKVHGDEQVYREIINTLTHVQQFGKAIQESYKKLRIAMEKHWPLTFKSYEKAIKVDKNNKLRALPTLDEIPETEIKELEN